MTAHLIPNPAPWIDNTGTVPDGVEADTVIDVEYRNGDVETWIPEISGPNNKASLWTLEDFVYDVIRWRKVQP